MAVEHTMIWLTCDVCGAGQQINMPGYLGLSTARHVVQSKAGWTRPNRKGHGLIDRCAACTAAHRLEPQLPPRAVTLDGEAESAE